MKLLNGATTNGTYAALETTQDPNMWRNGGAAHWFYASGAFGGGTVTIQISPDGLNPAEGGMDTNAPLNANSRWFNLTDSIGTITTTNTYGSTLARFRKVRAVLASSTGASITVEMVG